MRSLLIALTLLATALTFYSALWFKSETIEDDITARVTEDLDASGAKDVAIDVDGRHVTLSGVVFSETVEADYLDTANDTYGALGPIDGLSLLSDGTHVSALKTASGITLNGLVPSDAARDRLLATATAATDGEVTNNLTVGGPEGAWIDEADFGVAQLATLSAGTLTASATSYGLTGTAMSDPAEVDSSFAGREGWQTAIVAGPGAPDLEREVTRLNGVVEERDETIAGLGTQIVGLRGETADLQANIDAMKADEGDADGRIATLNATVAAGTAQIASLSEEKTTLQDQLDEMRSTEGDADARIASLNATVENREGEIVLLSDQANRMQAQLDTREADVARLSGENSDLVSEIATARAMIGDKESDASELAAKVSERDGVIAGLEATVGERDGVIADLRNNIAVTTANQPEDMSGVVSSLNAAVAAEEAEVARLNDENANLSQERDTLQGRLAAATGTATAALAVTADQGTQIDELTSVVAEREAMIADRTAVIADRDAKIVDLNGVLVERDAVIADRDAVIADRDAVIVERDAVIADRDATILERDAVIADRDSVIVARDAVIVERDATIAAFANRPAQTSVAQQCTGLANEALTSERINFQTASAVISGDSVELLERLSGIALACVDGETTLEIGGHTDAQGSDENNQRLSEERAQAVVEFMTERGVIASGVSAVGYGESQPVATNDTSEGRAQNRRISFTWN